MNETNYSSAKLTVNGFFYPFRALAFLLGNMRLLTYIAIPTAINTLLYSVLIWYTYSKLTGWIEALVPGGDAWYWAFLHYILLFLVAVVLILAVFYTFTLVGNLILAPFNEIISEKVEIIYSGQTLDEPFALGKFFKDLGRSYRAEAGRIFLYVVIFLLLLLVNLIPIVGPLVYGVMVTIYTLFFLCWEFLDYPMERWHFNFKAKRQTAFKNLFIFISFGAGSALLLIIPLANLAAIPVCVTGATLLFCDLKRSGRLVN